MATRLKRVLVWPDTHTPLHDKKSVSIAQAIAKDFRPDEVIYLGDFFDCESISAHAKDCLTEPKLLKDEMKAGRELLDENQRLFNQKKTVFMEGNHEWRIARYISGNAPKLGGLFATRDVLGLPSDYVFYPYGQENYYKIGNLIATHGYLAGENPAANTVKKFRHSVIMGHTHKLQSFHITSIKGEEWVGLNAGWLGDVRRAGTYMKGVTDWSLGFYLIWFKANGSFFYQAVHIRNGMGREAMFNGVLYAK